MICVKLFLVKNIDKVDALIRHFKEVQLESNFKEWTSLICITRLSCSFDLSDLSIINEETLRN